METLKSLPLSAILAVALPILMALVGALVGSGVVRRRRVALAIFHAYHIVEDIGAEQEGEDNFDKAAAVLAKADEWMRANGWRALKPNESERAELQAASLAGQARFVTAAAALVAPSPQTAPSK
jgi:hypothetical protein